MSLKESKEVPVLKNCLNCNAEVNAGMEFCAQCGQPNRPTSLKIRDVLKEFAENVFNLDGRLLMTLKNIWRPAHLTREYFSGKRKSYLLPTQFFLFSIFLCFALGIYFASFLEQAQRVSGVKDLEKVRLTEAYDVLSNYYVCDTLYRPILRKQLFNSKEKDTLFFPSKIGGNDLLKYKITYADVYSNVPIDSIFIIHNVDYWWDKFLLRQCIKFEFNPVGTAKFLIGNMAWAVTLLIFFMALFSKLLWIRHYSYYLEHLILWMNCHSMVFFSISIFLLIWFFLFKSKILIILFAIALPLLVLYNVRDYFKDGFLTLTIKVSILLFIYMMGLGFSAIIVGLISLIFL